MMTVVDVEMKEKALRICDKLYENGYIFKVKEYWRDMDSKFIKIMGKGTSRSDDEKLLKLFEENGFNAFIYNKSSYITLVFEKEVENESLEDCFKVTI